MSSRATAEGTAPPNVTAPEPASDNASIMMTLKASMTLDKQSTVTDVNFNGLTDVGDTIAYSFVVVNTGNDHLQGLMIEDPKLADANITITCDPSALAPQASLTCTASEPYTVMQADVDNGAVVNTANGTPPANVTSPTPPTDPENNPTEDPPGAPPSDPPSLPRTRCRVPWNERERGTNSPHCRSAHSPLEHAAYARRTLANQRNQTWW